MAGRNTIEEERRPEDAPSSWAVIYWRFIDGKGRMLEQISTTQLVKRQDEACTFVESVMPANAKLEQIVFSGTYPTLAQCLYALARMDL